MFKKTVITLILIISIISMATCVYASNGFPDVNPTDWFVGNLEFLSDKNIVQGNDKGEFMPNDTVLYNQYLKMVVVALTGKTFDVKTGEDWDTPYINKAFELGLIPDKNGGYSTVIDRYEMARIILLGLKEETNKDYSKFKDEIKDFNDIPEKYRNIVLASYGEGLIKGIDNGTFDGNGEMTRAMACTVIARLLDKTQRILPGEVKPPVEEVLGVKPKSHSEIYGKDAMGGNDLGDIPLYSKAPRIRPIDDPHNMDFELLIDLYTDDYGPLELQYKDMEILFKARFGENNATIKEVLKYVYSKKSPEGDLPQKLWYTNDREIQVWSPKMNRSISIMVWRLKK